VPPCALRRSTGPQPAARSKPRPSRRRPPSLPPAAADSGAREWVPHVRGEVAPNLPPESDADGAAAPVRAARLPRFPPHYKKCPITAARLPRTLAATKPRSRSPEALALKSPEFPSSPSRAAPPRSPLAPAVPRRGRHGRRPRRGPHCAPVPSARPTSPYSVVTASAATAAMARRRGPRPAVLQHRAPAPVHRGLVD